LFIKYLGGEQYYVMYCCIVVKLMLQKHVVIMLRLFKADFEK